jgi:predicted O-methyltransferase YrrM
MVDGDDNMALLKKLLQGVPAVRAMDRRLRRHYLGCDTSEFVRRGSFYSPLADLEEVAANRQHLFRKDIDVSPGVRLRLDEQLALVRELSRYYADFDWPEKATPGYRYYLRNGYFFHGDALMLYGILRHFKPQRVIEVGSGFSSALMLDTDERFLGSATHFRFIEPNAARLRSLLTTDDTSRVEVIESGVQEVPLDLVTDLAPNDILFIDSSHVSKVGSDVNYLVFEVLPQLREGVLVHFHDIFWPFEYPAEWVLEGRSWNEDYLLRAFLQYNGAFDILLFNNYLGHRQSEVMREVMPKFMANDGGSLWLQRTSPDRPGNP